MRVKIKSEWYLGENCESDKSDGPNFRPTSENGDDGYERVLFDKVRTHVRMALVGM